MNHATLRPRALCLAMGALLLAGAAEAQQKIFITNGSQQNKEIPLAAGSTVSFDTNGNLSAECALTDGVCTPLAGTAGGGVPGAPTISSFARNDGDTELRAGDFVRLTWGSSAAAACAADTTLAPDEVTAASWSGVRELGNTAGEVVTLPAAGDYTFALQCFNAAGGSDTATISVNVAEAPVGANNCNLPPDPLIQPTGWTRTEKTWVAAFSSPDGTPQAAYPQSVGFPVPIGAAKQGYTTIPFTPTTNLSVALFWENVQANSLEGYRNPRPANEMFISISPCPGDVRAPVPNAADHWLRPGCRKLANTATIVYTTLAAYQTNNAVCKLDPNVQYYINILAANPTDGLSTGEHTCSSVPNSANGCDVQSTHLRQ